MSVWLAIVGAGLITYLTRALPLAVEWRWGGSALFRRYLEDLPIAIIAALAGAGVLAPDQRLALGPEVIGAAVVVAVARWRRNLLLAILAGIAVVALLRLLL